MTGWHERVCWSGGLVTPSDNTLCSRFAGIFLNNTYFCVEPAVLPCDLDGSLAMFYGSSSFAG
jgi:hypothetical protein